MKKKIYLPKSLKELKSLKNDEIRELWTRYFSAPLVMSCPRTLRTLWYKIQCENHNLRIQSKEHHPAKPLFQRSRQAHQKIIQDEISFKKWPGNRKNL